VTDQVIDSETIWNMRSVHEVAITYCNGVRFRHEHYNAKDAITEYVAQLTLAVTQTGEEVTGRHIRRVSYMGVDDAGTAVRFIHTGEFQCDHQSKH